MNLRLFLLVGIFATTISITNAVLAQVENTTSAETVPATSTTTVAATTTAGWPASSPAPTHTPYKIYLTMPAAAVVSSTIELNVTLEELPADGTVTVTVSPLATFNWTAGAAQARSQVFEFTPSDVGTFTAFFAVSGAAAAEYESQYTNPSNGGQLGSGSISWKVQQPIVLKLAVVLQTTGGGTPSQQSYFIGEHNSLSFTVQTATGSDSEISNRRLRLVLNANSSAVVIPNNTFSSFSSSPSTAAAVLTGVYATTPGIYEFSLSYTIIANNAQQQQQQVQQNDLWKVDESSFPVLHFLPLVQITVSQPNKTVYFPYEPLSFDVTADVFPIPSGHTLYMSLACPEFPEAFVATSGLTFLSGQKPLSPSPTVTLSGHMLYCVSSYASNPQATLEITFTPRFPSTSSGSCFNTTKAFIWQLPRCISPIRISAFPSFRSPTAWFNAWNKYLVVKVADPDLYRDLSLSPLDEGGEDAINVTVRARGAETTLFPSSTVLLPLPPWNQSSLKKIESKLQFLPFYNSNKTLRFDFFVTLAAAGAAAGGASGGGGAKNYIIHSQIPSLHFRLISSTKVQLQGIPVDVGSELTLFAHSTFTFRLAISESSSYGAKLISSVVCSSGSNTSLRIEPSNLTLSRWNEYVRPVNITASSELSGCILRYRFLGYSSIFVLPDPLEFKVKLPFRVSVSIAGVPVKTSSSSSSSSSDAASSTANVFPGSANAVPITVSFDGRLRSLSQPSLLQQNAFSSPVFFSFDASSPCLKFSSPKSYNPVTRQFDHHLMWMDGSAAEPAAKSLLLEVATGLPGCEIPPSGTPLKVSIATNLADQNTLQTPGRFDMSSVPPAAFVAARSLLNAYVDAPFEQRYLTMRPGETVHFKCLLEELPGVSNNHQRGEEEDTAVRLTPILHTTAKQQQDGCFAVTSATWTTSGADPNEPKERYATITALAATFHRVRVTFALTSAPAHYNRESWGFLHFNGSVKVLDPPQIQFDYGTAAPSGLRFTSPVDLTVGQVVSVTASLSPSAAAGYCCYSVMITPLWSGAPGVVSFSPTSLTLFHTEQNTAPAGVFNITAHAPTSGGAAYGLRYRFDHTRNTTLFRVAQWAEGLLAVHGKPKIYSTGLPRELFVFPTEAPIEYTLWITLERWPLPPSSSSSSSGSASTNLTVVPSVLQSQHCVSFSPPAATFSAAARTVVPIRVTPLAECTAETKIEFNVLGPADTAALFDVSSLNNGMLFKTSMAAETGGHRWACIWFGEAYEGEENEPRTEIIGTLQDSSTSLRVTVTQVPNRHGKFLNVSFRESFTFNASSGIREGLHLYSNEPGEAAFSMSAVSFNESGWTSSPASTKEIFNITFHKLVSVIATNTQFSRPKFFVGVENRISRFFNLSEPLRLLPDRPPVSVTLVPTAGAAPAVVSFEPSSLTFTAGALSSTSTSSTSSSVARGQGLLLNYIGDVPGVTNIAYSVRGAAAAAAAASPAADTVEVLARSQVLVEPPPRVLYVGQTSGQMRITVPVTAARMVYEVQVAGGDRSAVSLSTCPPPQQPKCATDTTSAAAELVWNAYTARSKVVYITALSPTPASEPLLFRLNTVTAPSTVAAPALISATALHVLPLRPSSRTTVGNFFRVSVNTSQQFYFQPRNVSCTTNVSGDAATDISFSEYSQSIWIKLLEVAVVVEVTCSAGYKYQPLESFLMEGLPLGRIIVEERDQQEQQEQEQQPSPVFHRQLILFLRRDGVTPATRALLQLRLTKPPMNGAIVAVLPSSSSALPCVGMTPSSLVFTGAGALVQNFTLAPTGFFWSEDPKESKTSFFQGPLRISGPTSEYAMWRRSDYSLNVLVKQSPFLIPSVAPLDATTRNMKLGELMGGVAVYQTIPDSRATFEARVSTSPLHGPIVMDFFFGSAGTSSSSYLRIEPSRASFTATSRTSINVTVFIAANASSASSSSSPPQIILTDIRARVVSAPAEYEADPTNVTRVGEAFSFAVLRVASVLRVELTAPPRDRFVIDGGTPKLFHLEATGLPQSSGEPVVAFLTHNCSGLLHIYWTFQGRFELQWQFGGRRRQFFNVGTVSSPTAEKTVCRLTLAFRFDTPSYFDNRTQYFDFDVYRSIILTVAPMLPSPPSLVGVLGAFGINPNVTGPPFSSDADAPVATLYPHESINLRVGFFDDIISKRNIKLSATVEFRSFFPRGTVGYVRFGQREYTDLEVPSNGSNSAAMKVARITLPNYLHEPTYRVNCTARFLPLNQQNGMPLPPEFNRSFVLRFSLRFVPIIKFQVEGLTAGTTEFPGILELTVSLPAVKEIDVVVRLSCTCSEVTAQPGELRWDGHGEDKKTFLLRAKSATDPFGWCGVMLVPVGGLSRRFVDNKTFHVRSTQEGPKLTTATTTTTAAAAITTKVAGGPREATTRPEAGAATDPPAVASSSLTVPVAAAAGCIVFLGLLLFLIWYWRKKNKGRRRRRRGATAVDNDDDEDHDDHDDDGNSTSSIGPVISSAAGLSTHNVSTMMKTIDTKKLLPADDSAEQLGQPLLAQQQHKTDGGAAPAAAATAASAKREIVLDQDDDDDDDLLPVVASGSRTITKYELDDEDARVEAVASPLSPARVLHEKPQKRKPMELADL